MSREVLKMALDALDNSIDTVWNEYLGDWRHGLPTRKVQLDAKLKMVEDHEKAIEEIKAALAQQDPLFTVPVAARKWKSLQDEGYKMQQLSFARDGKIGTIDAWGKVLWQPEQNQFTPDYDTGAVLVEEQQRMAKQIAEMQDWEAIAANQALTIAMMKFEQETLTTFLYQAQEAAKQLVRPAHLDAYWCADLACTKCYTADFRFKHTSPPQRQPLPYEQLDSLWQTTDTGDFELDIREFARAIELHHGIGDKA